MLKKKNIANTYTCYVRIKLLYKFFDYCINLVNVNFKCNLDVLVSHFSPGTYQQGEVQRRHVEFEESFGRDRKLKSFVMVKCTNGIPDKVGKEN